MPAGRNRPLQAANRDFLEQSANFFQISPTTQKQSVPRLGTLAASWWPCRAPFSARSMTSNHCLALENRIRPAGWSGVINRHLEGKR
jgi:hypothetical protein